MSNSERDEFCKSISKIDQCSGQALFAATLIHSAAQKCWDAAIEHVLKSVGSFDDAAFEKWAVEYMSNPKNDRMYAPSGKECARYQHDQIIKKIKGDVG